MDAVELRRMVLPDVLPTSVCMERVITPRLSHTIFRSVAEADAVRHAGAVPVPGLSVPVPGLSVPVPGLSVPVPITLSSAEGTMHHAPRSCAV